MSDIDGLHPTKMIVSNISFLTAPWMRAITRCVMDRSHRSQATRLAGNPAGNRGWAAMTAAAATAMATVVTMNGVSAQVLAPFARSGLSTTIVPVVLFTVLVLLVVVLIPDPRGRPA